MKLTGTNLSPTTKVFLILISLFIINNPLHAQNKKDQVILATFKNGKIEKIELKEWLKARKVKINEVLKSKKKTKKRLKQMALERCAANEAKKNGFLKSTEYKFLIKLYKRNILQNYYIKQLREKVNKENGNNKELTDSYIKDHEKSLDKAKDVYMKDFKKIPANLNAILFKVGKTNFKVKDLNDVIDFIYKRRKKKDLKFNDKLKKNMIERIFREELLQREAIKKGYHNQKEFLLNWKYREINIQSGFFRDEVIYKNIKVTNSEVMEEYKKNKNNPDSKLEDEKLKNDIYEKILKEKKSAKRKEWEAKLMREYDFKIIEENL